MKSYILFDAYEDVPWKVAKEDYDVFEDVDYRGHSVFAGYEGHAVLEKTVDGEKLSVSFEWTMNKNGDLKIGNIKASPDLPIIPNEDLMNVLTGVDKTDYSFKRWMEESDGLELIFESDPELERSLFPFVDEDF